MRPLTALTVAVLAPVVAAGVAFADPASPEPTVAPTPSPAPSPTPAPYVIHATLTADPPAPQPAGTVVTFTLDFTWDLSAAWDISVDGLYLLNKQSPWPYAVGHVHDSITWTAVPGEHRVQAHVYPTHCPEPIVAPCLGDSGNLTYLVTDEPTPSPSPEPAATPAPTASPSPAPIPAAVVRPPRWLWRWFRAILGQP